MLALLLADGVDVVSGGPSVNYAAALGIVLRHTFLACAYWTISVNTINSTVSYTVHDPKRNDS